MTPSSLLLLSVTHRTAPLTIRDRLAFDAAERAALLRELGTTLTEAAAIVTCNRTEIYGLAPGDAGCAAERATALLARCAGMAVEDLAPAIERLEGDEAARHLFRVAAGLDSIVVGEPQILGQVREAAEVAAGAGTLGPTLAKLFNLAIVAGKRARSETPISRGAGSVSYAAVELARAILGDLRGRRAVVVGLGEMGQLVARNLVAQGVGNLAVCNRTPERAEIVARDIGGRILAWEELDEALATADIAVCATGARDPILTRERLRPVAEQRAGRPLLLIDIAVPRDVEPAAGKLPGIHLRDIDALRDIRSENLRAREEAIPRVEEIIEAQVAAFADWRRGRAAVPVIRELRAQVEAIREREVEKALRRLGHLDERDREVVLALSHGLANKFLHGPTTRLKATEPEEQPHYAQVVADLFDLESPDTDA